MEDSERKRRTAIAVDAKNKAMEDLASHENERQAALQIVKQWILHPAGLFQAAAEAERVAQAYRVLGADALAEQILEGAKRDAELAQQVRESIEQTDRDVAELTGDPNSTMLDDWDIYDISSAAEFARQIKQTYGVQLIVKPEIRTHDAGRRKDEGYDRAFARIYITRECKPVEAFELYLQEEDIRIADEDDRATTWNRFDAAIRRRRRAAK